MVWTFAYQRSCLSSPNLRPPAAPRTSEIDLASAHKSSEHLRASRVGIGGWREGEMALCPPGLGLVSQGRIPGAVHDGAHVEIAVKVEQLNNLRVAYLERASGHDNWGNGVASQLIVGVETGALSAEEPWRLR